MPEPEDAPARSLTGWKLATAVIIGFWCLHLVYRTTIALVAGKTAQLLDPALDLSLTLGFLMSFGFCGVLALLARRGLAFGLGLAALLSLPTSIVYATTELVLFYHLSPEVNGRPMRSTLPDGTVVTVSASGDVTYAKPGGGQPTRVKLPPVKQMVVDRALQTVTENTTGWYFFFFGLGSFFVGMSHAARLRSLERRAAAYQRLAQHAQLETLRYQINPHLLFNTLNSLSALMMAGRTEPAETMILNLSRFYRSTLAIDPTGDIPLREELELQRLYLDIEAVRYPDRLRFAIDAADELLDAQVPALLLQPLVENAIKHGVARRTGQVTISIAARREGEWLVIEIENEAGTAGSDASGTGTGLRNVGQRLQTRFGPEASCIAGLVDGGRFRATVTLPLGARVTQPLRVLIVDDEPLAIERLEILLGRLDDVVVVGSALSGTEALSLVARHRPDLCLLDIAMPEMSGIDIARTLARQGAAPRLVFVTAFDSFAVAAFEIEAVDYLVKPVDPARLAQAIARVRRHVPAETRAADSRLTEFWVSQQHGLVRIAAADIDRITAERDYMRLHIGARSWLINDSLARLAEQLDPETFLRLHRGAIVNRRFIHGLRRDENGWIALLGDGSEQKVGRSYADNIRQLRGRAG